MQGSKGQGAGFYLKFLPFSFEAKHVTLNTQNFYLRHKGGVQDQSGFVAISMNTKCGPIYMG